MRVLPVLLGALAIPVLAVADVTIQLLEGGGNAAAYGQVMLFRDGVAIGTCPPAAYSGDNCLGNTNGKFGLTTCVLDYDLPAGTLITARVRKEFSYGSRCSCADESCALYPPCAVEFGGFSGACLGFGTSVTWSGNTAYECTFGYGDVTLGTSWAFSGSLVQGEDKCVAVPAVTTTTRPGATTTSGTTPTTTLPDPLFAAVDALAEGLLGKAVTQGLARLGTDFVTSANSATGGTVKGTASAVGAAPSGARGGSADVVIAKGKSRVRKGRVTLRLKLTKPGRKLVQRAESMTLRIDVVGAAQGRRSTATRTLALTR